MMANEAIAALDEFAVTGDPVDFLEYKEDRTETAASPPSSWATARST